MELVSLKSVRAEPLGAGGRADDHQAVARARGHGQVGGERGRRPGRVPCAFLAGASAPLSMFTTEMNTMPIVVMCAERATTLDIPQDRAGGVGPAPLANLREPRDDRGFPGRGDHTGAAGHQPLAGGGRGGVSPAGGGVCEREYAVAVLCKCGSFILYIFHSAHLCTCDACFPPSPRFLGAFIISLPSCFHLALSSEQ